MSLPTPGVTPPNWGAELNAHINAIDARVVTEEAATVDHEGRIVSLETVTPATPVRVDLDIPYLKSIATNALTGGFGVTGDGTTNDTSAVSSAITAAIASSANLWNAYHVIYFPQGTYILNNLTKSGSAISNLLILGDGNSSIFKRVGVAGNTPMATLSVPVRLRIQNMAFDMNGLTSFGGWKVYGCQGYYVEDCRIYDSVNAGFALWANSTDLFGFLIGAGTLNKDIVFRNNVVEDLQTEFDDIERCLVEGNTILRQPTSTAFGSFMINGSTVNVCRDVTVRNNTFIDSNARCITFNVDSSSVLTSTWQRIVISGNKMIQRRDADRGIQMGANNATWPLTSVTFEDIIIENNEITYDAGSTGSTDNYLIYLAGGINNNLTVNRCRVSGNTLKGNGKNLAQAMRLNFLQNYMISGNRVEQGTGPFTGLLMDRPNTGKVLWNTFQMQLSQFIDQAVFQVTNSLGNNVFSNNFYRGVPGTTLFNGTGTTGDVFTAPSAVSFYGDHLNFIKTSYTPGAIAAGAQVTTTLTTTRGGLGTRVRSVAFSLDLQGVTLNAYFSATNTLTFVFFNGTAGEVTLGSGDIGATAD